MARVLWCAAMLKQAGAGSIPAGYLGGIGMGWPEAFCWTSFMFFVAVILVGWPRMPWSK